MLRWRLPAVVALAASAAVYFAVGSGASGARWHAKVDPAVLAAAATGESSFLIYMNGKADLRSAQKLAWRAKTRFVYERLRRHAASSQKPLLAQLRSLGVRHRSFWITNAVWATGNIGVVRAVASRPDVAHVYAGGRGRIPALQGAKRPGSGERAKRAHAIAANITKVRAPLVWALGYRGQGAVVAGADTGVRWDHEALKTKYRGWTGSTPAVIHDYNWNDAIPNPNSECPGNSPQPCDDDLLNGGHGTHTMGTMVGSNPSGTEQIGMAPDAKWIACRNMNNGLGVIPTYFDCMEWFMAPTKVDGTNPLPERRPDVVNNSWGCVEVCPPPALKDALVASRAAGIFYAVSAGNDGLGEPLPPPARGCGTINHPLARYVAAFTVGATVIATDKLADFSSRGPTLGEPEMPIQIKPNVVAPGVDVRSSVRDGTYEEENWSGTSMAGPHVAGLVALLISAKPSLRGNVEELENIIEQSALHIADDEGCGGDVDKIPNNAYGWGRIDALAAVQRAIGVPTSVGVASLAAQRQLRGVRVTWRTTSETRVVGFDVWRSAGAGAWKKLNSKLIAAKRAGRPPGAAYAFVDGTAARGVAYAYRLQVVDQLGKRAWFARAARVR